uniref:Clathrin light chain n=1 Tax=Timspurckia oligopyrenoides TaxID=708627 RepID=A0A7S0ZD61_9RHOD|mmetsp:Transcript_13198/g.23719  ORF Transcript_13198/g.23719 Transcript_13198/m.23719 type:complete len:250 (+) Transcript_13198:138-887(+)|eukprot:CAMPEP_0182444166 /NCGR_PEP_ID=MMETSP1172-20130603/2712_1 /TAXON_ID=708627 /ORGANISM="Timspurckia oligopyrenoides, Strain CCMP3278" /LENGTH=249 /DNA_ID=CAMNT_0024639673 /DNA_START=109 /DNA_END=858 /DNA_ORIENTATION=-
MAEEQNMEGGYGDDDFFKDYPNPGMGGGDVGAAAGAGDDPFGAFFGDDSGAPPPNMEGADVQQPEVMYMPPPGMETMEPMEPPPEPETMTPAGYGAGGSSAYDEPPVQSTAPDFGAGNYGDDDDDDELPPSRPETPRAIREWRAEFAQRIEQKRVKEDEMRAHNLQESRATIQRMYERWQERCVANRQLNTEEESRFLAERDALQAQFSAPGEKPNWNMIPQLANLSGEFKKGQRDTSRMRSVILKLKT